MTSLWMREAPVEPGAAEVRDASCELLVIGAGLAGLSAAREASERGADVLVIDRGPAGSGASGRNAGFVLLAHVFELPGIVERVGTDGLATLMALARRSHAILRERYGAAAEHAPSGSLMLSVAGDDEEEALLHRAAALLRAQGADPIVGPPHEALEGYGIQVTLREDAGLHPGRLCAAMAAAVPRVAMASVEHLEPGVAHLAGGGRVSFGRALVATNAWAAQVVPSLADVVTPHRAQMLATAPLPRVLEPVAYARYGYDYFRQRDDGVVLLGGVRDHFRDAEATADARPTAEVQEALEACLHRHLPFARGAAITDRWAGIMGFSPDELPLCGPAPGLDRVDVLAGFTGHGLGLAAALAERWAAHVVDGVALPGMFAPERFDG